MGFTTVISTDKKCDSCNSIADGVTISFLQVKNNKQIITKEINLCDSCAMSLKNFLDTKYKGE